MTNIFEHQWFPGRTNLTFIPMGPTSISQVSALSPRRVARVKLHERDWIDLTLQGPIDEAKYCSSRKRWEPLAEFGCHHETEEFKSKPNILFSLMDTVETLTNPGNQPGLPAKSFKYQWDSRRSLSGWLGILWDFPVKGHYQATHIYALWYGLGFTRDGWVRKT